jgi:hypothetical protein
MATTSSDVIDQEAVRAEVEQIARDNRQFRRAFRQLDNTDIDSNSVEVPVEQDDASSAGVVGEGEAFPEDGQNVQKVSVSHEKYGVEVPITYEAIEDSLLDVIALQAEGKAEDLADTLNSAAYDVVADYDSSNSVYNNLQDNPIGDDSGTMDYPAVVDAMTALESEGFDPDLLIVSAESKGDLLKSDAFTRASELGDEAIESGSFGEIAGVPVYVSDSGDLGAGEGMMFDSDSYGFESVRERITSEEYDKPEKNKRVIQIRTRLGWEAVRPSAGVKIEA